MVYYLFIYIYIPCVTFLTSNSSIELASCPRGSLPHLLRSALVWKRLPSWALSVLSIAALLEFNGDLMGMEVSSHEIHETWKKLLRYWYILVIWRYEGEYMKGLIPQLVRNHFWTLLFSMRPGVIGTFGTKNIFRIPEVQRISLGKKKGIE